MHVSVLIKRDPAVEISGEGTVKGNAKTTDAKVAHASFVKSQDPI
jgi:hypothetical protein